MFSAFWKIKREIKYDITLDITNSRIKNESKSLSELKMFVVLAMR